MRCEESISSRTCLRAADESYNGEPTGAAHDEQTWSEVRSWPALFQQVSDCECQKEHAYNPSQSLEADACDKYGYTLRWRLVHRDRSCDCSCEHGIEHAQEHGDAEFDDFHGCILRHYYDVECRIGYADCHVQPGRTQNQLPSFPTILPLFHHSPEKYPDCNNHPRSCVGHRVSLHIDDHRRCSEPEAAKEVTFRSFGKRLFDPASISSPA